MRLGFVVRIPGPEGDAVPITAPTARNSQALLEVDDHYLVALAKQGKRDAYDQIIRRYHGFVRLKASSYFLIGGDSDDLIQEGLVGLYKAVRDYRSDRESSFRNFAELCITRQIITAVKTSTRNKHTPLNQYVSFSYTPATAGDAYPVLQIAYANLPRFLGCEDVPGPTLLRRIRGRHEQDLPHSVPGRNQDQRGAPCLGVPIVIRRHGIVVDLDGKCRHGLQQVVIEELIAERGEE